MQLKMAEKISVLLNFRHSFSFDVRFNEIKLSFLMKNFVDRMVFIAKPDPIPFS